MRLNSCEFSYNCRMAFALKARVVFPVGRPPIEYGVVTIDDTGIVDVGEKSLCENVTDLGSVALVPGFVNAHTHLEFSYLKQPLGLAGMSLVDWIRLVIAERAKGATPSAETSGAIDSIRFGVTTIGNIATGDAPLLTEPLHFHEVIGFSRARAQSALEALLARLPQMWGQLDSDSQGISPHAPYTVSRALLKELVSIACKRKLPMAMHLAESREELELLRDGTGPFKELLQERSMWDAESIPWASRPLDYLKILVAAPRTLVIHGNYLDAEELAFLADNRERMSLIYCPRTHAYFRHSPYPLEHALTRGVRVGLGTDSLASNPDLNLLAEMRHVMRAHPSIDPAQVLRMGTLDGAEALGRHPKVGSITPGTQPNLVALPIPANAGTTPDEVLTAILADDAGPSAVYAKGRLF
jgi:aminodeoxyfutalosine deaminase